MKKEPKQTTPIYLAWGIFWDIFAFELLFVVIITVLNNVCIIPAILGNTFFPTQEMLNTIYYITIAEAAVSVALAVVLGVNYRIKRRKIDAEKAKLVPSTLLIIYSSMATVHIIWQAFNSNWMSLAIVAATEAIEITFIYFYSKHQVAKMVN